MVKQRTDSAISRLSYMKKTVLVTGITGLLGSTLKIVLEQQGFNVADLGLDITNTKALLQYVPDTSIDWVIHTAAITDTKLCETDRNLCYKVNFEGTKNVRDLARRLKS